MAKQSKAESAAKKALKDARAAIDRAIRKAKKVDKSARKDVKALVGKLEKRVDKVKAAASDGAKKVAKPVKKVGGNSAALPGKPKKSGATDRRSPAKSSAAGVAASSARAKAPAKAPVKASATAGGGPSLADLRARAKASGLTGYSRLNKTELKARLSGR